MRRTKTGVLPSVDVMEPRLLLSTAAPLLSKHALTGVVREVRAIVSTLAKTGNTAQAGAQLTELASQIPTGSTALALSWQSDLGLYRPHSAWSAVTTETRIVSDLYRDIQAGVANSNRPASGSGSTSSTTPIQGTGGTADPVPTPAPTPTPAQGTAGTSAPVSTPSLDSVQIQNTTGLAIVVTVRLMVSDNQQPSITETIPAHGNTIATFDFGTATNDFMTMDVSSAVGDQGPPPWSNINLSQPLNGYDGTLYTISLFGSYFSVNVP
jgi:hypothetical protein